MLCLVKARQPRTDDPGGALMLAGSILSPFLHVVERIGALRWQQCHLFSCLGLSRIWRESCILTVFDRVLTTDLSLLVGSRGPWRLGSVWNNV